MIMIEAQNVLLDALTMMFVHIILLVAVYRRRGEEDDN
jgi:hypothetical protein